MKELTVEMMMERATKATGEKIRRLGNTGMCESYTLTIVNARELIHNYDNLERATASLYRAYDRVMENIHIRD